MIYECKNLRDLFSFNKNNYQVAILKRAMPKNLEPFFKKLYLIPFSVIGSVTKISAKKDIHELLKNIIPKNLQKQLNYEIWLQDMSSVCKTFCSFTEQDKITFWLGSERGCKRYHVDMVNYRLLLTYAGQGTELLPDKAANRNAFINGEPNEKIVKDKFSVSHIPKWDISIFRGGNKGILHRTPNSATDNFSSILMRLDAKDFLEDLKRINGTI